MDTKFRRMLDRWLFNLLQEWVEAPWSSSAISVFTPVNNKWILPGRNAGMRSTSLWRSYSEIFIISFRLSIHWRLTQSDSASCHLSEVSVFFCRSSLAYSEPDGYQVFFGPPLLLLQFQFPAFPSISVCLWLFGYSGPTVKKCGINLQ